VKSDTPATSIQQQFDFSTPLPRPFLTNLTTRIDTYEEGVARYFRWRTGLDFYATIDQVVDFVILTKRLKVVDLQTDTGTFALRLAGRKGFHGRVYSFDSNITLLERARQRAQHLNLHQALDFKQSETSRCPVPDNFAEIAVSIFDFHRQPAQQFLAEAARILMPEGHLLIAEMIEPKCLRNRWLWKIRKLQLRYLHKNPAEAEGVYYDQEEILGLLFGAGFRQVIVQGLKARHADHEGVFSLLAATK
jgi:ubiquinone/menaquinone biosynthesis C-methylase UbiE